PCRRYFPDWAAGGRAGGGAFSVWRKMLLPFVLWSFDTSVLAAESKATSEPPPLTLGLKLSPSPWVPSSATLTRVTLFPSRSARKMSRLPLVSSGTRLSAPDQNVTQRPSGLIDGSDDIPSPCVPSEATLTRVVLPSLRSKTKMSPVLLVSSGTRSEAFDQ